MNTLHCTTPKSYRSIEKIQKENKRVIKSVITYMKKTSVLSYLSKHDYKEEYSNLSSVLLTSQKSDTLRKIEQSKDLLNFYLSEITEEEYENMYSEGYEQEESYLSVCTSQIMLLLESVEELRGINSLLLSVVDSEELLTRELSFVSEDIERLNRRLKNIYALDPLKEKRYNIEAINLEVLISKSEEERRQIIKLLN